MTEGRYVVSISKTSCLFLKLYILRENSYVSGPILLRPKEIDGLLVPPGKAYIYTTVYWLAGLSCACPGNVVQVRSSIGISVLWLSWMVIFQTLVGCHDFLTLGKSLITSKHQNMTLAVD